MSESFPQAFGRRCRAALSVPLFVAAMAAAGGLRAQECDLAELVVGEASGRPGDRVDVELRGGVNCDVTGFSCGIGHDSSVITFAGGEPGEFISDYAGADLSFYATGRNEDGYALVGAIFDLSFPITVLPTPIERGTVLAVLSYDVALDAPPGPTPLLNRTRTYGSNPMANVYSRPPGETPIDPDLVDGAVTVLGEQPDVDFARGDANGDGERDISDPIFILIYLFLGTPAELSCPKSADVDDVDGVTITDPIYLLEGLFHGGPPPPPPYPGCGRDPTPDDLGCESSPCENGDMPH